MGGFEAATNEVDTAQRVGLLDGEVEAAKSQAKHRAHYQLDRAHGRSAEELRARQAKELQALRVAHRRRAEANTKARAMEKAALHEDYGRKGACDAPACVRSSHPAYLRYHLSDTLSMHWFLIVQWRRLRVRRVRSSGDSVAV